VSLAGLQARAGIDAGLWDERAMAEVVDRSLSDAETNEYAIRKGGSSVDELLARPMYADPLRKHDCPPVTDGAAALVLAAGDKAHEVCERPAWITGISHYVDQMSMGTRDLTRSPSTERSGAAVGLDGVEVAELHAPFSHQELILRRELGLGDDVRVNPSGGALASNPMFSAGGIRVGEAAKQIWSGAHAKVLAHATSGPALQQNLVCTLEGRA
jgi:acetyl-CoA acetyltransferase